MDATQREPVTTESQEQLASLIADCAASKTPVIDYGKFHQHMGHPPADGQIITQAGGILDHYERDMTVRVAAGMTVGKLNEALAATKQFCPIDADDDITVGEALNHNMYGSLRVRYGGIRDLLLGLSFINSKGELIKVGGRTVKNVAGLDLTRLMVGSLGELGAVCEATIRTYAIPEQISVVTITASEPSRVSEALTDWMLGEAYPTTLRMDQVNSGWQLKVSYFGSEIACDIQTKAMKEVAEKADSLEVQSIDSCDLSAFLKGEQEARAWRRKATGLVKAIIPPAQTGAVANPLALGDRWHVDTLPAHGCIFVGGEMDAAEVGQLDQLITELVEDAGGMRAWISKPHGSEAVNPFAPEQPDWSTMTKIKKALDPDWLFNPGRFILREDDAS